MAQSDVSNSNQHIAVNMIKASGFISLIAIFSKLLGFIRETVIAAVFGASGVTDAYLVANMFPSMLFASIGAAIVTVFIPVFTEVKNKHGLQEGFALVNKFGTLALSVVGVLVLLGELFTPALVKVLAPGFTGETYKLTVALTRIFTPVMFIMTLTYLATASLNGLRKFSVPAMVGIPYNLIIISVAVLFGSQFGIYGLVIGTMFGVASQFVIQLPELYKTGYRIKPTFDPWDSDIKKIGFLIVPVILSSIAGQVNLMVDRILASGLAEGSISALNFANRVNGLPMGLFVASIITVLYPSLSEHSAKGNIKDFTRHLEKSLGMVAFLTLPIMVGFIVLREPFIKILFERGAFDADASRATAVALFYYAIGITPTALSELIKRGFWALQDTKTPMLNSFITVGSNVVFNLILVRWLGHGGLALGTSLAATLSASMLFWFIQRQVRFSKTLWVSLNKSTLASTAMAIYCYWAWQQMTSNWLLMHPGFTYMVLALGGVVASSAALYFAIAYLLKIEEMTWSLSLVQRALARFVR